MKPFTEKVIACAGMTSTKPVPTPLPLSHSLYKARRNRTVAEKQALECIPCQQVLASLLFCSTRTRPDISMAVSMLSKFQEATLPVHWKAMQRVVRYIDGTQDHGVMLLFRGNVLVEVWFDADWARYNHKYRFCSGFIVAIGGGQIVWSSRIQSLIA